MDTVAGIENKSWTVLQKVLFRFFFIYLILYISPWSWLTPIPGIDFILTWYDNLSTWAVVSSNENFFRVFGIKKVQPVFNGSGDTSYYWAQQYFLLYFSAFGCVVWSLLQMTKKSYRQLNYLLCLLVRYNIALIAFGYGFIKILGMQMQFPLESQLATPLGDLLPMRLSWLFIGYSAPYQMFSGIMEVTTGILLLYRKTVTMGVLVATAVFINVMMLNLSYDIPVKLYSLNIVVMCFYLLANEFNRIACFFVLNKPAPVCGIYNYVLTKRWMKVTRIILKLAFLFTIAQDLYTDWNNYKEIKKQKVIKPFSGGEYTVTKFVVNKDTLAPLLTDSLRWQDVIIDAGGSGSIKTADTLFRRRYGRGYFVYTPDTGKHTIDFKKFAQDSTSIFSMAYQQPDSATLLLMGKKQNDSLYIELKKSKRSFQLAEKQFHWLSEANR